MQVLVCLAFAVSGDPDINELGNSNNADTGVQNDTEIFWDYFPVNNELRTFRSVDLWIKSSILLTRRPCWFLELQSRFRLPFYFIFIFCFLKATHSYLNDFSADLCCPGVNLVVRPIASIFIFKEADFSNRNAGY